MVCGNIGSAALKRLDYTVIGDTVNVSQRLQAKAAEGQIFISDSAYQKVKEAFKCNLAGEINVKNKKNSILVYEVIE